MIDDVASSASIPAASPLAAGFLAFGYGLLAVWLSGWPASNSEWQDQHERLATWHLATIGMASCLCLLACLLCKILIGLMACTLDLRMLFYFFCFAQFPRWNVCWLIGFCIRPASCHVSVG